MAWPSHNRICAALALAMVTSVTSTASLRAVQSQKSGAASAFTVVSISENKSGPPGAGGDRFSTVFYPAGRFTARNATLKDLVLSAYRDEFPASQISGFVGWMLERRFDVDARTEAADAPAREATLSPREIQLMTRSLLEDRFTLRVRRADRTEEVHVLSVASGGHKLKPAKDAEICGGSTAQGRPQASQCHMLKVGSTGLDGVAVDTADIAGALQFFLQHPVIDRARLPGLYEASARWKAQGTETSKDPDMVTAMREQLGLTLDVERRPIPTLIVQSAAMP